MAAPTVPRTPPPEPPEPQTVACSTNLDGTLPHVAAAGHYLAERFDVPVGTIGGRAGRARVSDHPAGLALDFPVNRATGDALAEYAVDNRTRLGIAYVIWQQEINTGRGWVAMEDRGSPTENHLDHVHLSFEDDDPPGPPFGCAA